MIRSSRSHGRRRGFTIVELLVTITVIGILVALLLPAVQSAREAARQTQCKNNLKQLALAVQNHEGSHRSFPSNGWGWRWIGDPDRGVGKLQPGGWIYQLLSFIERADLRSIGSASPDPIKRLELADLTEMSIPAVRCPSRPSAEKCPRDPLIEWRNAELREFLGRSDYVGNGGDDYTGLHEGPVSLSEGDSPAYSWPETKDVSGVFFLRSAVRPQDVTDGLTSTYLLGEKYVGVPYYHRYGDKGYDQSFASGDDWDLVRWTEKPPLRDAEEPDPERFGSAHFGGFNVAMCDGSVRTISYVVDSLVHKHLGHRRDGVAVAGGF